MSDTLARLTQALADRYRLERELGQGGMATVYLAEDLRHDRRVAMKVLRPELAAVIGAERFLAEIKVTANLQHPHILPLHDSGEAGGFLFYVMPYVEGETLRDRLVREQQLPVADAVRLARDVAGALDYAHKRGVVHRDIKPENILLHDGSALVADFGIALAASQAGDRMTQTGMSLGTPSYMSPEQAMGDRAIGPRSDVYALGAMTYEMLVGEPPFAGPTAQAIVAKVLTEEPASLVARRRTVPPAVEHAVLTALEKLPADRFATAAEFATALGAPTADTVALPRRAGTAARSPRRPAAVVGLAAALLATAALAAWGWLRPGTRPAETALARYEVRLPYHQRMRIGYSGGTLALSPDGGTIAYVARRTGGLSTLMVRDRDQLEPRALEGTSGADAPFFSPDGAWIGYAAQGRLFKVPVRGGAPTPLADSVNVNIPAGHWGTDGIITYVGAGFDLRAITDEGGPARVLAGPSDAFVGLVFPHPLPRGGALLASGCAANCAEMTLLAIEPGTGDVHELAKRVARAWYRAPGQLVYVRQDGGVFVQAFDERALALRGTPEPLIQRVGMGLGISPELALGADGSILHVEPGITQRLRVARVFRDGRHEPVDPDWMGDLSFLSLSPDGRRLAVTVADGARTEVWVKQLDRGPFTRLAYEGSVNYRAAWQPDGRTLGFISDREGRNLPYQVPGDGSAPATRVPLADTLDIDELDWSRDGKWLAYRTGARAGVRRVAITPLPSTAPGPIEPGPFDQYMPAISPDARWLAYVSVESGREEVYVRPVAAPASARWQVSTAGGTSPVWSHAGRELLFVDASNQLVSVPVAPGPTFQVGDLRPLFRLESPALPPFHQGIAVTPDDRAFLFLQDASSADQASSTATLTLHALAPLAAAARGR
ncbi:MAG: protein kinase [Gemmatimonadales bacterium]|nr:protein kinase [Gemmatimonadales bacterium]